MAKNKKEKKPLMACIRYELTGAEGKIRDNQELQKLLSRWYRTYEQRPAEFADAGVGEETVIEVSADRHLIGKIRKADTEDFLKNYEFAESAYVEAGSSGTKDEIFNAHVILVIPREITDEEQQKNQSYYRIFGIGLAVFMIMLSMVAFKNNDLKLGFLIVAVAVLSCGIAFLKPVLDVKRAKKRSEKRRNQGNN